MEFTWIADLVINVPEGTNIDEFLAGLEDRITAYIERRGGKALGTFNLIEGDENGEENNKSG